ncbi:MAG TPA: dephospho-CoA kinase [Candidatus Syntrophosphaera sp.]|jgi:dephospho-CoA kinase|nr:dephospho-CoA kinase [Candidatus Syntrophosphaera sp.]
MATNPILIGITGNIGSGKSKFCHFLREAGVPVVFADDVAQEQLALPATLKQLVRRWGPDVAKGGKADRAKIAGIVFQNKQELDFLNSVIHPGTLVALQKIVEESEEKYIFFEVPLLFEAGLQNCFDFVVLVRASRQKRLQRLTKGGKAKAAEMEARMDAQIDDTGKIPLCDLVVDNDGTPAALKKQAEALIERLPRIKQKDKIPFST